MTAPAILPGEGILVVFDDTTGRYVARVLPDAARPALYTDLCYADTPQEALNDALASLAAEDLEVDG